MGFRQKLSALGRPIAFFSAWWMLADIVLDYLTVHEYKSECERIDPSNCNRTFWKNRVQYCNTTNAEEQPVYWIQPDDFDFGMFTFSTKKADITCLLWPLGALSMILPTVAMTFFIFCCRGYKGRACWKKIAYGPLYFISAPITAVKTSTFDLCCASNRTNRNENRNKVAYLKLAETLFEALPQVAITATYLAFKGRPWQKLQRKIDPNNLGKITLDEIHEAFKTWLPLISGIWSIAMIIIGTVTGSIAGAELEQEWGRRRKEQQERNGELKYKRRELTNLWVAEDDKAYEKLQNELVEKGHPETKREQEQISKLRNRRLELEGKEKRSKKEETEHEKIMTKLRNLPCTEMRKSDKHMIKLKENRLNLESKDRTNDEDIEYENVTKELLKLGCPEMKEDILEINKLKKEKTKLENKKRSPEEEETYKVIKKELRKFGCPEMKKSDARMAELNLIWSDLKMAERNGDEEREFENAKVQLRMLGCQKMRARDEEMAKLWQKRTELEGKERDADGEREFADIQVELRQFGCPKMRKKDEERIAKLREKRSKLKKKERTAEEDDEYELIKDELRRLKCGKMKKSDEKLNKLMLLKTTFESKQERSGTEEKKYESILSKIKRLGGGGDCQEKPKEEQLNQTEATLADSEHEEMEEPVETHKRDETEKTEKTEKAEDAVKTGDMGETEQTDEVEKTEDIENSLLAGTVNKE